MRWLTAIVLISAAATLWLTLHPLRAARSGDMNPPRPVSRSQPRIFAGGIVEGVSEPVGLRFEISGRVRAVVVKEGDRVRMNQVLAELESDGQELRIQQAEAQLQIATAERNRVLGATSSARSPSESAAGTQRISNGVAKEDQQIVDARVRMAETQVRQEQLLLDKCYLVSPRNGIILQVDLKPGDLVGLNAEAPGITMVDRSKTRVRAFIEEYDALRVAPGAVATVTVAGNGSRTYPGRVLSCAPVVQPKRHRHLQPGERLDVRVRTVIVELDDASDLLIGLPVELFIEPTEQAQYRNTPSESQNAGRRKPPATTEY